MVTTLRQLLRTCQLSLKLLTPSKRRFMRYVCLLLSFVLLGLCIISCINRAKADTPTPTPIPSNQDYPPGGYPVPLISRGSWGYGQSYLRFDSTTTANNIDSNSYITEWEFTGVPGYYNFIEFSMIGFGSFPQYDQSQFDSFNILYFWESDNVEVEITSIQYNNTTYIDGDTGFLIGDWLLNWGSEVGNTALVLTYTGELSDLVYSDLPLNNLYLTLNTDYHVSAPDTVKMYAFAAFVKSYPPEPTPAWLDPPSYPETEGESGSDPDQPFTFNLLNGINNTLVWLGGYIKTAVEQVIGNFNDLSGGFILINSAFSPLSDLINDLSSFAGSVLDDLAAIPTSARIDFDGWSLVIPAAGSSPGASGQIIPPIHYDVGAMLESMGLATWLRWGVRFCALVGLLNYLYAMPKRILSIMSGRVELYHASEEGE